MKILTQEEMKALPTKRLLAYRRKLWHKHPGGFREDWESYCTCSDCIQVRKNFEDFDRYMNLLKEVLSTREHIPTPAKEALSAARRAYHARIKKYKKGKR